MGLWQSTPESSLKIIKREFKGPVYDPQGSDIPYSHFVGAHGWVWYRYRPTWIEAKPFHGSFLKLPVHLILFQRGKEWRAIYPTSDDFGNATSYMFPGYTGLELRVVPRVTEGSFSGGWFMTITDEPEDIPNLVPRAVRALVRPPPSPIPQDSPLHGLGFCTWSSLGENNRVTRSQLEALLTELKGAEIPVQAFMIDDGWLNQRDRMLWAMEPNEAFGSLKEAVDLIKSTFEPLDGVGSCKVGVWLTLNGGYWNGIHPNSPLVARFPCERRSYTMPDGNGSYVMPATKAFWEEWFTWLKEQGVSFLKVDNQASVTYLNGSVGQAFAVRLWYDMTTAADAIFGPGSVVHCMAHSASMFNRAEGYGPQKFWWRNSDDFGMIHNLPNAHQVFIFSNLANAPVSNNLSTVPDADMFMSRAQYPRTHAVLRAMFPGPVMLSDKPGEHDPELIRRLIAKDAEGLWRVLKCESAAEILGGRLLDTSVMDIADGTATWASVRCGHGALLAAFNCRNVGRKVVDHLTRDDVEDAKRHCDLKGDVVVLRCDLDAGSLVAATVVKELGGSAKSKTAAAGTEEGELQKPDTLQAVELDEMEVMLWRIVPKSQPFGLVDKFAGLNCIDKGKYLYEGKAAAAGDDPLPRLDGGKSEIGIKVFDVKPGDHVMPCTLDKVKIMGKVEFEDVDGEPLDKERTLDEAMGDEEGWVSVKFKAA